MTVINKSALVPYSPAQMFALVDDIEAYPEFLPWCKRARVLSRTEDEVRATIELSKGGVEKAFTTCNRIQKNKMIQMRLVEGPFKRLDGFWRFDPLGEEGCKVSLDLEFEFASRMLSMVVGPVFSQVANSLVDSFQQRAVDVYG
ncbi:ribosome-associated toxin RatA of RatAB toxin-antitoxin module [Thiogranum longum]|uniref:Ribosome-associated toxin RatA of RatAB toxin-antitoxin module n=1 Tax=Thiogranum longum TaxID=1537524 RepID=A0A4R1H9V5_9GAMM|nr:type II toxin-antitoxin system RatA family toxin [Thiogranum longum]TCK18694.1 ribosome-associated toxin RatA of RatAB toxin-antitoxin module [Thiogranum longum]